MISLFYKRLMPLILSLSNNLTYSFKQNLAFGTHVQAYSHSIQDILFNLSILVSMIGDLFLLIFNSTITVANSILQLYLVYMDVLVLIILKLTFITNYSKRTLCPKLCFNIANHGWFQLYIWRSPSWWYVSWYYVGVDLSIGRKVHWLLSRCRLLGKAVIHHWLLIMCFVALILGLLFEKPLNTPSILVGQIMLWSRSPSHSNLIILRDLVLRRAIRFWQANSSFDPHLSQLTVV
jgi:hypothetical protein